MYRFSFRPVSSEPLPKTLLLILIIIVTSISAWFYMDSPYWGVFALCILLISLNSYFIRTDYLLDESGVIVKAIFERKRKWPEFKRVIVVKNGLFLSASNTDYALDSFRGEFLPVREKREEILEFVQRCIDSKT